VISSTISTLFYVCPPRTTREIFVDDEMTVCTTWHLLDLDLHQTQPPQIIDTNMEFPKTHHQDFWWWAAVGNCGAKVNVESGDCFV
jgi:hypothetical protein